MSHTAWMLALVVGGCAAVPPAAPVSVSATEHRGLWVATVANIDWPSSKHLSGAQRRAEMLRILDTAQDIGLNAIYFQARPCGDAMYLSNLEPWSEFLTGASGKEPFEREDPLAEWIRETHDRGMELHVWINPFRVGHPKMTSALSPLHPARTLAAVTRTYGEYKWLDPAEPIARQHALSVVEDIAKRYDIDGLHIDDYFYPYPTSAAPGKPTAEFPDDAAWGNYRSLGGTLSRADWRRSNINSFLLDMNARTRAIKPALRIGVSPFGIWQPDNPPGVKGLNAFASLYADSRKWLTDGTFDYMAPQLYWKVDAPQQKFKSLLDWWVGQNARGKRMYAGLNVAKVGPAATDFEPGEITRQIDIIRATPGAHGFILFSAKPILENRRGVRDALKAKISERKVAKTAWTTE